MSCALSYITQMILIITVPLRHDNKYEIYIASDSRPYKKVTMFTPKVQDSVIVQVVPGLSSQKKYHSKPHEEVRDTTHARSARRRTRIKSTGAMRKARQRCSGRYCSDEPSTPLLSQKFQPRRATLIVFSRPIRPTGAWTSINRKLID